MEDQRDINSKMENTHSLIIVQTNCSKRKVMKKTRKRYIKSKFIEKKN